MLRQNSYGSMGIQNQTQAGLASVIAGLASAAQAQGQAIDPNTIAALASLAGGAPGSFPQAPQSSFNTPRYSSFQPPASTAPIVNPLMVSMMNAPQNSNLMNNRGMTQNLMNVMPTTSAPSGANLAALLSNFNASQQKPASQMMPPAQAKSESVSDILNRLKSLADLQKR
jgi:hypothetical protein